MIRTAACISTLSFVIAFLSPQSTARNYENLNAVVWVQTSVEYKATAIQTYRAAKDALLLGRKDPHWTAALEQSGRFEKLPKAVILDLDETVLDNSAFRARLTASGETYSESAWSDWMKEERAGLVPGALDFIQFAVKYGVTPLFVTNRKCDPSSESDPTVRLLRKLQLPVDPAEERLYCDDGTGDKSDRRKKCSNHFRILLLIGDQLADFVHIPAANVEGREKLFEANRSLWGKCWFQLPNPMYGTGRDSWEGMVGFGVDDKLKHLRQ
jgi:5'-nucleotidase (lipoprotein e(P4) family)